MIAVTMKFPEGKRKALTLSYDDGVVQDKRLVEILNRYGIKCTFNINSGLFGKGRRLSKEEAVSLYSDSGHEVAVHALTHASLAHLTPERIAYEIGEDRKNLEKIFGRVVRGMAYPYGTYNDKAVQVLETVGIAYSRTTLSTGYFSIPHDWLRLPATCHHNDKNLMQYAKDFTEKTPTWSPWLFYLWGHSYEFDDNDNWEIIEEFARFVGKRNDIWYATNIEIYDYIAAYNGLKFSFDNSIVTNSSSVDVWLDVCGREVVVRAGEINKAL